MSFFSPESQPWKALGKAVDFVGLSLCTVFISLPIITIAPALAALYSAVVKEFRYGDNTPFKTYFESFRKNFKQGVILMLIFIPVVLLLSYGYAIMKDHSDTRLGAFLFTLYYVLLFVPAGIILNSFPLLGLFEYKTSELLRSALIFTFMHLFSSFIIVLLSLELTIWTIKYYSPCFITPSLWALLSSFFLEKNYKKHLSAEEAAKLENLTAEEYLEKEKEREAFRGRYKRQ